MNNEVKISHLVPILSTFALTAVVADVQPPREFAKKDGSTSRVATLWLRDETGGVHCTLWGDRATLTQTLQPGMTVRIENAVVKSTAAGSTEQCELHMDHRSDQSITIVPMHPVAQMVDLRVPVRSDFLPLARMQAAVGRSVNVLCRVDRIFPPKTLGARQTVAQTIRISDRSAATYIVFWGPDGAQKVTQMVPQHTIIFLEAVQVRQYNNKPMMRFAFTSRLIVEPNLPAAETLRQWFNTHPAGPMGTGLHVAPAPLSDADLSQMSYRLCISEVEGNRQVAKTAVSRVSACIVHVTRSSAWFVPGAQGRELRVRFDIMDHTGTLHSLAVNGVLAERLLSCNAANALAMDEDARDVVRENAFWSRRTFFLQSDQNHNITVLGITGATHDEEARHIRRVMSNQ